jgi:Na+-translocating ferredoxin:NAD+ oxidoreductase RnfG subunit/sulfite exporter TauE/SafE
MRFVLEFLLGRLVSYVVVGGSLGMLRSVFSPEAAQRWAAFLYIPLGLLLVLHVLREADSSHRVCRWLDSNRRFIRTPLLLGLAAGLVPCPPFALAAASVFKAAGSGSSGFGEALEGALYFLFFFVGSSAAVAPLALAGAAGKAQTVRRLARSTALLAGLFFLFSGMERTLHPPGEDPPLIAAYRDRLAELLPEADAFSDLLREGDVPYVEARRTGKKRVRDRRGQEREVAANEVLAVCICTSDLSNVRGYGDEIPVLVAVDPRGTVKALRVLEDNRETPGYVRGLYAGTFPDSFLGKGSADPVVPGEDVDTLTGATISAWAVADSVRESLAKVCTRVLGLGPPGGGRSALGRVLGSADLYILVLFFAVAVFGATGRRMAWARELPLGRIRVGLLTASVVYLGLVKGLYLTGGDLVRIATGRIPPLASAAPWFLLAGGTLVLVLVLGKVYCAWICPFGALQEFLYRVVPPGLSASERVDRAARKVRWVVLAAFGLAVVVADNASVLSFEPLAAAFVLPWNLGAPALVLLGALAICSALVERFYCKFICPLGGLVDLLTASRLSQGKGPCGGCYLARPPCRYLAENGDDFEKRRETLRGDCIC